MALQRRLAQKSAFRRPAAASRYSVRSAPHKNCSAAQPKRLPSARFARYPPPPYPPIPEDSLRGEHCRMCNTLYSIYSIARPPQPLRGCICFIRPKGLPFSGFNISYSAHYRGSRSRPIYYILTLCIYFYT